MPIVEERVTVTIPKAVFDKVSDSAANAHRSVEEQIAGLIQTGLDAELSHQELFDRHAESYRSRLAREGKLNKPADQVLAELRATRDKVADEFYPD